jgi:hypothetical protein
VGTCHAMGGHRSLLLVMVLVWVQIRRKLLGSAVESILNYKTCHRALIYRFSIEKSYHIKSC